MTELFDVTKLIEKYRKLEQENERLKEDIMQAHKDWEYQKNENYRLACRNAELKEEISIAKENYGLEMEFQTMYRKTLEEIRELVKGCKTSEGIVRQTITEYLIQNKINEVLK